jgi:hypothetical protein
MLVAVKSPPSPAEVVDTLPDHFVEMGMLDVDGMEPGRRIAAESTALAQRFKTFGEGR